MKQKTTNTTPLGILHAKLVIAIMNLCTVFEMPIFTQSKDRKNDPRFTNTVVRSDYGSFRDHSRSLAMSSGRSHM